MYLVDVSQDQLISLQEGHEYLRHILFTPAASH